TYEIRLSHRTKCECCSAQRLGATDAGPRGPIGHTTSSGAGPPAPRARVAEVPYSPQDVIRILGVQTGGRATVPHTSLSIRISISCSAFLLLTGCDTGGSNTDMRVLAGLDTVTAAELVRVGGAEAEGAAAFVDITSVLRASDGLVYVLDGRRLDVSVFDEAGAVVRQFGGHGRGPGELASAPRMGSFADTVWVLDWLRQTTHFFDRNGEFLDFRRIVVDIDSTRFAGSTLPLAFTSAGLAVFEPH